MRPFRILRRALARARNWGGPHVHCPGCGADCPLPENDEMQRCFTCRTDWFRHRLSGDATADLRAIKQKLSTGAEFTVTFRPVVVDVPGGPRGKHTELLDSAFVYLQASS